MMSCIIVNVGSGLCGAYIIIIDNRYNPTRVSTLTGKSKMGRRFRWRLVKLMFGEKIISRSTTSL